MVFREYVEYKKVGIHPKSHLPLLNEWRQFFYNGECFLTTPYWSDGIQAELERPLINWTKAVGNVVEKNGAVFIAVDSVQREDGTWNVLEINDGGTSGIPDSTTPSNFYTKLADVFR